MLTILGGLFATAVFLYPALQLKRRKKWPITVGLLMALAGLGLIGIVAWLMGFAVTLTSTLVVGGIGLILLAGIAMATVADLSDKQLDHPWHLFMIPPLAAIVLLTGSSTFDYLGKQLSHNANTISSRIGQ